MQASPAPEMSPEVAARMQELDKINVGIRAIAFMKSMVAFGYVPDHHLSHAAEIFAGAVESWNGNLFTPEEWYGAIESRDLRNAAAAAAKVQQ